MTITAYGMDEQGDDDALSLGGVIQVEREGALGARMGPRREATRNTSESFSHDVGLLFIAVNRLQPCPRTQSFLYPKFNEVLPTIDF
jgi:hypothetical protein